MPVSPRAEAVVLAPGRSIAGIAQIQRLHLTERPRRTQTFMAGLPVRWFASKGGRNQRASPVRSSAVKLNVEPRREPRSTVALRLPPFEGRPIVVQLSLAYGFIARGLLGFGPGKNSQDFTGTGGFFIQF